MKALALITIFSLLLSAQAFSQYSYKWDIAKLNMNLPFNPDNAEIVNDNEGMMITLDDLELEFLIISKDSAYLYYSEPYYELIREIIDEFDIIPLSSPSQFPNTTEGTWIIALDTLVFTDSLVLGALSHPSGNYIVLAVFDCYGFPLSDAVSIMRSLRFSHPALKNED